MKITGQSSCIIYSCCNAWWGPWMCFYWWLPSCTETWSVCV